LFWRYHTNYRFCIRRNSTISGNRIKDSSCRSLFVIITDANGCTSTVNGNIDQPGAALSANKKEGTIACFGGTTTEIIATGTSSKSFISVNFGLTFNVGAIYVRAVNNYGSGTAIL